MTVKWSFHCWEFTYLDVTVTIETFYSLRRPDHDGSSTINSLLLGCLSAGRHTRRHGVSDIYQRFRLTGSPSARSILYIMSLVALQINNYIYQWTLIRKLLIHPTSFRACKVWGISRCLWKRSLFFLLCFSVFHVFYFIYFYMFEIKNSQMLKYFFGHGKIKLPWDSIHFSYLRSRLILYLGHLKGRVQQEDQYLFKTILSGRMVSIENEERTSLADLLQRCRLGTVNMFIKEKREIHRIYQETHKEQLQRTILNLLNLRFHFSTTRSAGWAKEAETWVGVSNITGYSTYFWHSLQGTKWSGLGQKRSSGVGNGTPMKKGGGGLRSSGSPFCITVSI